MCLFQNHKGRFSIKKKPNMVLKHFILPVDHFKANLLFPHYNPPLPYPITQPRDCRDGDTKRGLSTLK